MLKSLMKECYLSEERLMRSSIWNSLKVIAQILLRLTITMMIFLYNRESEVEFLLSLLRAVLFTEIIIYVYSGVRRAIGRENIQYETYYETIFGNKKFTGDGEYGMITSFLKRILQEVVVLAVLVVIYVIARSQLEDVLSEENIQWITIGVLCIPYLISFYRIGKYISYFYKAKSYIGFRDDAFKVHNHLIRMRNNCPEAPDIVFDCKGAILFLIILTWPFRAFFGSIAIIATRFLALVSVFIGFVVLGLEVIGILILAFKYILPVVEMHQMTTSTAFSYWPEAVVIVLASIVSFFLIKYRFEMMEKIDNIHEAMTVFRYGMIP